MASNQSNRDRRSRPKRTLIRYTQTYTVEEESFCSNNSEDSDYIPKKPTGYDSDSDVTPEKRHVESASTKTNIIRWKEPSSTNKNYHIPEDSASSQDSMKHRLTQKVKRKVPSKQGARKNDERVREAFAASQSQKMVVPKDEDDGSDSSLFFTDEISEASNTLKEHPKSLSKNTLLRKAHLDSSARNAITKPLKRKDLSASRKASKKIKLNDTDEVEFIPDPIDCITIESDSFSELETVPIENTVSNFVKIKTEKKSPSVKIEKVEEDNLSKKSKHLKKKLKEPNTEFQSFECNSQIKSERLHESFNIEMNDHLAENLNSRIKIKAEDPLTDVVKVKKEKEDEKKPIKKSTSKEKLASKDSKDQKVKIKKEKIKTEIQIPSTSRSDPVEKSKKTQVNTR